jgi:hypothetical protein
MAAANVPTMAKNVENLSTEPICEIFLQPRDEETNLRLPETLLVGSNKYSIIVIRRIEAGAVVTVS